jgi:hydrogenase maturation protease
MTVLVACFGNVLRADDGVGVVIGEQLLSGLLPDVARVLEVGIGGLRLVQELLAGGIHALLVVDAVDLGRHPGSVMVQVPEVLDVQTLGPDARRDALADMHLATPSRALMMARALGVLPEVTLVVGVQTQDTDEPRHGLSATTARAVPVAVAQIMTLLAEHADGA